MSITAFEIHDMTVAYHRKPVLWDIDLVIPEGKLVGIIGPNGAGKTTLIKAALGLVPLASGKVEIYGEEYVRQRHLVGYVPQRESVDWDFPVTVDDVVLMGGPTVVSAGFADPARPNARSPALVSIKSACWRTPNGKSDNYPVVSNSVSFWPAHLPSMPDCISWMSRFQVSTRPPRQSLSACFKSCETKAKLSLLFITIYKRFASILTMSFCSTCD